MKSYSIKPLIFCCLTAAAASVFALEQLKVTLTTKTNEGETFVLTPGTPFVISNLHDQPYALGVGCAAGQVTSPEHWPTVGRRLEILTSRVVDDSLIFDVAYKFNEIVSVQPGVTVQGCTVNSKLEDGVETIQHYTVKRGKPVMNMSIGSPKYPTSISIELL